MFCKRMTRPARCMLINATLLLLLAGVGHARAQAELTIEAGKPLKICTLDRPPMQAII